MNLRLVAVLVVFAALMGKGIRQTIQERNIEYRGIPTETVPLTATENAEICALITVDQANDLIKRYPLGIESVMGGGVRVTASSIQTDEQACNYALAILGER